MDSLYKRNFQDKKNFLYSLFSKDVFGFVELELACKMNYAELKTTEFNDVEFGIFSFGCLQNFKRVLKLSTSCRNRPTTILSIAIATSPTHSLFLGQDASTLIFIHVGAGSPT